MCTFQIPLMHHDWGVGQPRILLHIYPSWKRYCTVTFPVTHGEGGSHILFSIELRVFDVWQKTMWRNYYKTRSRVGKSPWVFRLSLSLVDFTAMVFRHVLLAASFLARPATNLVSKFWPVPLWTRVTLGLDMCKVCTEAVHSLALWTRVTLQVWTCVHYVLKQSIP